MSKVVKNKKLTEPQRKSSRVKKPSVSFECGTSFSETNNNPLQIVGVNQLRIRNIPCTSSTITYRELDESKFNQNMVYYLENGKPAYKISDFGIYDDNGNPVSLEEISRRQCSVHLFGNLIFTSNINLNLENFRYFNFNFLHLGDFITVHSSKKENSGELLNFSGYFNNYYIRKILPNIVDVTERVYYDIYVKEGPTYFIRYDTIKFSGKTANEAFDSFYKEFKSINGDEYTKLLEGITGESLFEFSNDILIEYINKIYQISICTYNSDLGVSSISYHSPFFVKTGFCDYMVYNIQPKSNMEYGLGKTDHFNF